MSDDAGSWGRIRPTQGWASLALLAALYPSTGRTAPFSSAAQVGGPYCAREYADDFASLAARTTELEQRQASYTFCIRTTAIYECPFYGPDGSLHLKRRKAVAHGTGFAYKQQGRETLLLTNQHVAEWPSVTDDEHRVEDVPVGCRRVSDSLKVVEKESDAYEVDDIPLSRVAVDPQLDMAVLKARVPLPVLPWKVGRSAGLRDRNVVDVRGFPLGAFKATNVGKVVSAYDHDDFKEWDHDDFVVDALLSPGNSGSPVLAISCKTGEFELVGVYHAGYSGGSALNVVVGIDQVRDMMTTLKRKPRVRVDASASLDAKSRVTVVDGARVAVEPFFSFGALPVAVRVRKDGALVYELLARDFPVRSYPIVVLEDLPPTSSAEFGSEGRVWFGSRQGLRRYDRSDLEAETQALLDRLLDALRHDSVMAFAYQAADRKAGRSREHFENMARLERAVRRGTASRQELSQNVIDLSERLAPQGGEQAVGIADALQVPDGPKPAAPLVGAPFPVAPPPADAVARVPEPQHIAPRPAPRSAPKRLKSPKQAP